MAEQLSFQAKDGGSIPHMDALVDAKTTKSVLTLARLRGSAQDGMEKSAQVQILQHAKGRGCPLDRLSADLSVMV
jgi:hypothetical protein